MGLVSNWILTYCPPHGHHLPTFLLVLLPGTSVFSLSICFFLCFDSFLFSVFVSSFLPSFFLSFLPLCFCLFVCLYVYIKVLHSVLFCLFSLSNLFLLLPSFSFISYFTQVRVCALMCLSACVYMHMCLCARTWSSVAIMVIANIPRLVPYHNK